MALRPIPSSLTVYCRGTGPGGPGVARQEADCRVWCARRGLGVRDVLVDEHADDRSAFEHLLASRPRAVLVLEVARLLRTGEDLRRVLDLDVPVHAVRAGEIDLATDDGRRAARELLPQAALVGTVRCGVCGDVLLVEAQEYRCPAGHVRREVAGLDAAVGALALAGPDVPLGPAAQEVARLEWDLLGRRARRRAVADAVDQVVLLPDGAEPPEVRWRPHGASA